MSLPFPLYLTRLTRHILLFLSSHTSLLDHLHLIPSSFLCRFCSTVFALTLPSFLTASQSYFWHSPFICHSSVLLFLLSLLTLPHSSFSSVIFMAAFLSLLFPSIFFFLLLSLFSLFTSTLFFISSPFSLLCLSELVEDRGFLDILHDLISDANPTVVSQLESVTYWVSLWAMFTNQ